MQVLWRIARAHDELFVAEKNAKKKEEFARKGAAVATRATELEPENPAAHRWRGVQILSPATMMACCRSCYLLLIHLLHYCPLL